MKGTETNDAIDLGVAAEFVTDTSRCWAMSWMSETCRMMVSCSSALGVIGCRMRVKGCRGTFSSLGTPGLEGLGEAFFGKHDRSLC